MLFVIAGVEACGKFRIVLQRLRKYSSLTATGLRVLIRKTAGKRVEFSAVFIRDRFASIPSTEFRRTFPHEFSGIVFRASRACARGHYRPAAAGRSCRPSTSPSN